MNCPNCGTPEEIKVRVCNSCGEGFVSEDLHEFDRLKFLVHATASWNVTERLRKPYIYRLEKLRSKLVRPSPEEDMPEPVTERAADPQPLQDISPKEKVPFDQWLLSERNIKFALYSGALLLVIAGLIFIGVNWTRIPGPGKFAITLLVTGLMYLGGNLLFKREAYRLGGVALLAIASGFLALNFAVLQLYVFGPRGLNSITMWLIASLICLILYTLTTYLTRSGLFTYISTAALFSSITAVMVSLESPFLLYPFVYSVALLVLALLARFFESTKLKVFTTKPLLTITKVSLPILLVVAVGGWMGESSCSSCLGSWYAIGTVLVGAGYYVLCDFFWGWQAARWAASVLTALFVIFILSTLDISHTVSAIIMLMSSFAYLGGGYLLERTSGNRRDGLPLFVTAYCIAGLVTLLAAEDVNDLILVLFADVALLGVSAAVHRGYRWVFGAAWLFMLPVYLWTSELVPELYYRGMVMGILGLNYVAIGYILGRRELRLGGPFLTAAAFLSLMTTALVWENSAISTAALTIIATLYILTAIWLDWPWLLVPGLVAINLLVFIVNFFLDFPETVFRVAISYQQYITFPDTRSRSMLTAFLILGTVLVLGAQVLRRNKLKRWTWPLYSFAAIDLFVAYLLSFLFHDWMTVAFSAVLGGLLLGLAWLERDALSKIKIPLLTYIAAAVFFVAQLIILAMLFEDWTWDYWMHFSIGLCVLFVVIGWLLRREPMKTIYGTPFRNAGLTLMAVPLLGSIFSFDPTAVAITFAVAGIVYAIDAAIHRKPGTAYLSAGSFLMVIWAVLLDLDVTEPQAFIIPAGLALVIAGWLDRREGRLERYRWLSILGLVLMMGSLLVQSLGPGEGYPYAILLALECVIAIFWGIRTHSRSYVQVGGIVLIANTLVQLAPGFVNMPRWIQIGLTGGLLLGIGLMALFQRERLLKTRQRFTDDWRKWNP